MIKVNKNLHSRIFNIKFGLLGVTDGLIRILSIGYLTGSFQLEYARKTAKKRCMG